MGQRPVRDSNPSRLLDRQVATPAASQGGLKSVRRESHPPVHLGKVVPGLLGHGHPKARTEGVEPSACALEAHCSPGSTSLASGRDRSRTCKGLRLGCFPGSCRLRSAGPSVLAVPVGLEPTPVWVTTSRTTVVLRDSFSERPGGFEPPHPPWHGGRLPGYIMDALGPRASRRSHELPDSNRLLQILSLVLKPISGLYAASVGHGCQFRRLGSSQRPSPLRGDALTV
jgi:hypothetical protein